MLKISLFLALVLGLARTQLDGQSKASTRLAIVGLDHDHVWGMLKTIAAEPQAELVAISDTHAELVEKAKGQVPASVKFYSNYVQMLDEARPEAVIVTTANNRHLEILRECAKRKIHFSTEKPMASTGADAREMERLAREANIKLMVNYWNAWTAPTHELFHRVYAGELGPVQKIIVQYGHQGPKEIGVSKQFADWLYDPVKNGGGALVDFGCYGAEWALWLKGRPTRVYAYTLKLKTEQHNAVDDDATILLEYADATVIIQASWDWPHGKAQVEVFGPKGSLLAMNDGLLFHPAGSEASLQSPQGQPVVLHPVPHETSNPVAYFLDCIRNDKPIEDPVSASLNVGVNEILDAAKESIRSGRAVELSSPSNDRTSRFSTESPVILSDTQGVDFGPYIERIVTTIRRNWYALMPQAAQAGQKGRVAIAFEILKDGTVPQVRLAASSGTEPLDRATLASIRTSAPFPPLPEEFSGNHLVLRFIFLYNLGHAP